MPSVHIESTVQVAPAAIELLNHIASEVSEAITTVHTDLDHAWHECLDRLLSAAEAFETGAHRHGKNTGRVASLIYKAIGFPPEQCEMIRLIAETHDIGKIGIPLSIITKPGRLDAAEYEIMKQHTLIGGRILNGSPFLAIQMAHEVALSHHERWDGSGYPFGSKNNTIPVTAQVVAIADTFDALTHRRSYKDSWSAAAAADEICSLKSTSFNPEVVDAFNSCFKQGLLCDDGTSEMKA